MTDGPLVSVIIPTYNRANVLGRSLNSVLNQTYQNFEILVIDDGSFDNTKTVIKQFSDLRINYFMHEKNMGQNVALNSGLNIANGEYIAFLDSDDEWFPLMLEKQIKKFQQDENLGVVYTWAGVVKSDGSIKPSLEFSLSGDIYKEALFQGYVSHMITLIVKKRCFDKIGLFDIQFTNCQDDDICIRLAKEFRFGLIPEVLAVIHNECDNIRVTGDTKSLAEGWLKLFNKHKEEIIRVCGNSVMANHYIKCGKYFILVHQFKEARKLFSQSFYLAPSLRSAIYYTVSMLPFSGLLIHAVRKLKIGNLIKKII